MIIVGKEQFARVSGPAEKGFSASLPLAIPRTQKKRPGGLYGCSKAKGIKGWPDTERQMPDYTALRFYMGKRKFTVSCYYSFVFRRTTPFLC